MIPLATTTVTIYGRRPQAAIDPDALGYDPAPPEPELIAAAVPATISLPAASRQSSDADSVETYAFRCDPVEGDVNRFDTVVDDTTDIAYNVATVQRSFPTQYGLEHIAGRLYVTKGLASGGGTVVPA